MNVLQKYLKKIGVSSHTELTSEELETYKAWSEMLSGRRLTDADVATFFNTELEDAITKLTTRTLSDKDDNFLKVKVDFIRKVKTFLATPEVEKRVMEQQLERNLNL